MSSKKNKRAEMVEKNELVAQLSQRGSVPGFLTLKGLSRDIIIIAACVGGFAIHKVAAVIVLLALSIWSLRNASNAVRALILLVVLLYLNPIFGGFGREVAIARWITFFAACGRIIWGAMNSSASLYSLAPIRYLHAFCAIAVITTAIANPTSLISYLKIFSFMVGTTALFAGAAMNAMHKDRLVGWIVSVVMVVSLVSMIMYPLGLGRFVNPDPLASADFNGKFMGILSHPQSLGTFLCLSTTFILVMVVYSTYTLKEFLLGIISINFILIYFTSSRGALITTIASAFAIVGFAFIAKMRGRELYLGAKPHQVGLLIIVPIVALSVVLLRAEGGMKGAVESFLLKGRENIAVGDIYSDSRGLLIELSMQNFRKHPLTGIGFGVPSLAELDQRTGRGGALDLAFAPTEKGNLATAVLEETGIAGTFVLVCVLISFYILAFKTNNIFQFALFTAFLLMNMTEMIFFSLGGLGLYGWALMAVGLGLGDRTTRQAVKIATQERMSSSQRLAAAASY